MSAEEPLRQIVEYSLQQLCEIIPSGETVGGTARTVLRCGYVRIIHSLPITCRTLFSQAHIQDGFEAILFYERVRLGLASSHFFMDGVPASVTLFTGPTSITLPDDDVKKLKLREIIADRLQTVGKLELMRHDLPRKVHLVQTHHPDDLSRNVPGPVRVFVARCRAMCRSVRRLKRQSLFVQCNNCNCNRLFYTGEGVETWSSGAATVSTNDSEEEEHDSSTYWDIARGDGIHSVPDTRRFCCQACASEHAMHLKSMMPDNGLHLDVDDGAKKSGRARVGEAFRMALKRNEIASRALRNSKTRSRSNLAVSQKELSVHRTLRITALNVDLGLLYASSIVSESSNLSRGKVLPGSSIYWRDDPSYYAKPLSAVAKIYSTTKREEGIISNMLTIPRFLEAVELKASRIF